MNEMFIKIMNVKIRDVLKLFAIGDVINVLVSETC